MSRFEDLLLLNYYEGWFSGAIQDESYVEQAIEFYFGWLTGIANEYGIPTDYDESPDGCSALHEDIEEYLKDNIVTVDLEDTADYVLLTIKERYKNAPHIYEMDILEVIDNERIVTETLDIIYMHCIDQIKKEYMVI